MTAQPGRVPPNDLGAERALLGAALLDPDCLHSVLDVGLEASDFYAWAHGAVWGALLAVVRDHSRADVTLLRGQLAQAGDLAKVGGDEFLLELTDTIPQVDHAERYACRVRDLSAARATMNAAYALLAEAYGGLEDVGAWLDRAEVDLARAAERRVQRAEVVTLGQATEESIRELTERAEQKRRTRGYPSGIVNLDRILSGFAPGQLVVLAGRPAMGKTALGMQIATGVATLTEDAAALVFELEMGKSEIGDRAIASDAGVDLRRYRNGVITREDWPAIIAAAGRLSEVRVKICDTPALSALDIARRTRQEKRRNENLRIVVVDYLQLLRAITARENREREVAESSARLKQLAKEEQVCVLALCQLNRKCEERKDKRPQLSDLRESGAIEQDADAVLFVYRDEVYDPHSNDKGIAEIIIGKQRSGPAGMVRTRFVPEHTRFDNLEESHAPHHYYD